MTYNQVIKRIKTICLAHKQVRSFYRGFAQDFLSDKTRKYPAIFMEDSGGLVSTDGHSATFKFRLSFWDLVNVSEDAKTNEQDVDSDMVSICLDVIAQMNYPGWQDWKISSENPIEMVISENNDDEYGGCTVDFSASVMYTQNVCAVPSDFLYGIDGTVADPGSPADRNVYDLVYVATGTEGTTLTIPALQGKRILLITYESSPIYKVSNNPDQAEYHFDGTTITVGVQIAAAARFLILYRNY